MLPVATEWVNVIIQSIALPIVIKVSVIFLSVIILSVDMLSVI